MATIYDFQITNNDGEALELAPLVETAIVTTNYITGASIEIGSDLTVRIVGWEALPQERRIVTRLVMSDSTARVFMGSLRRALCRGGN